MIDVNRDLLLEREAIRELIQLSGALLDQERFAAWIALFAEDARYELLTDSPELGGLSPWLDLDRASLAQYLDEIPERVRYRDQRRHLIVPITIRVEDDVAAVYSHFAVFRTAPDGVTQCEVAGRYHDTLGRREGDWRIVRRRVELDTHHHPGHHVPL